MAEANKSGSSNLLLWISSVAVLIVLIAAWFFLPLKEWATEFNAWIVSLGAWGVVIFGIAYIAGVMLMVPAGPLTIAAGVAFGFWALPLVLVSASIGAVLSFLIARYVVREKVERFVRDRPRFAAVDKVVSVDGWKIVGLVRLSPIIPFNIQNYFFGVTKVDLLPYTVATFIGIIPGATLYVYLGKLGKEVGSGEGGSAARWIFLGVGLAATAAAAIFITMKAKAELKGAGAGNKN